MRLSGLSHAEQVARMSEGGATLVQLREKHLAPREFYREAEAALRVARANGVRLIINDRVDIALALRADGVHLGQDDLQPEAARRLLGERAIIGFSTHNVEQAREAARLPINYIAIGPIFATTSKDDPGPTLGLDGLRIARVSVKNIPVVAIGGITRNNARAVLSAGVDSLAVITALAVGDPSKLTDRMRHFLDS